MAKSPGNSYHEWKTAVEKEIQGRSVEDLEWETPEGIQIKPLYTAEDLENLEAFKTFPGFSPYLRGSRASMYVGRPWTVRQYAGFSSARATCTYLATTKRTGLSNDKHFSIASIGFLTEGCAFDSCRGRHPLDWGVLKGLRRTLEAVC